MRELTERSSGTVIQKYAKVIKVILNILVSLIGAFFIVTGIGLAVTYLLGLGICVVLLGIVVIVLGVLLNKVYFAFISGYGEIVEDLRQIRVFSETQAQYFEWLEERRKSKSE